MRFILDSNGIKPMFTLITQKAMPHDKPFFSLTGGKTEA